MTNSSGEHQWIGKYRLLEQLGCGASGRIFRALDSILNRTVALKLLNHSAGHEAEERFLAEARIAARLNHPHIVGLHDVGHVDGQRFLVLEFMAGGSLREHLRLHGAISWREACRFIRQAALGLAAAHGAGVLHRDIKPANLLMTQDGTVKLADFGLARLLSDVVDPDAPVVGEGTPAFMSPEQCRGEPASPAADIYSLGATFYTLLTDQPPFTADSPLETIQAHLERPVPDPREVRPEVPAACSNIIQTAMAKSPRDRFTTVAEFLLALDDLPVGAEASTTTVLAKPVCLPANDGRRPSRRRRWIAVAVLSAALACLGGWAFFQVTRPARTVITHPAGGTMKLELRGPCYTLAFSPDETALAAGLRSAPGGVVVWEWRNNRQREFFPGATIQSLAFSPDGRTLAASDSGGTSFYFADLSTGRTWRRRFEQGHNCTSVIAFRPDGKELIAGLSGLEGGLTRLMFFGLESGEPRFSRDGHSGPIYGLVSSQSILVSSSLDGTIKVWNDDGTVRHTWQAAGPTESMPIAVSAARTLAVGGKNEILVYDLAQFEAPPQVIGTRHVVWSVSLNHSGSRLASAGGSHATLWDRTTRQMIADYGDRNDAIARVLLTRDARFLAVSHTDRPQIRIHAVRE